MSGIGKRETDKHFYDFSFKYCRPLPCDTHECAHQTNANFYIYIMSSVFRETHYFTYVDDMKRQHNNKS